MDFKLDKVNENYAVVRIEGLGEIGITVSVEEDGEFFVESEIRSETKVLASAEATLFLKGGECCKFS